MLAEELGELGDGGGDVFILVVQVDVSGAVDDEQFLGLRRLLDRLPAEVGALRLRTGDHQQGAGRDEPDHRVRVVLGEQVDASQHPSLDRTGW